MTEAQSEPQSDLKSDDRATLAERASRAVPIVRSFLETVLNMLGVEVEVDIEVHEEGLHCDLNTGRDEEGLLIGRHGATLDALQYLTLRVLHSEGLGRMRITVDVGGYRGRREKTLRELADGVAQRVKQTGRPHHFEPMSAMERRVVHLAIDEAGGLRTESEGEGRRRHVVVFRADGSQTGSQDADSDDES